MPFGLMNAPATFQSLINTIFQEYLNIFVIAYLDNILVYTKSTLKKHAKAVKKVLKALQQADMRLRPNKCEFHKKEVKFLESIITIEGIKMDQEKVKAVTEWPELKNLKEVQAFLGFANFYQKFIRDFSKVITPLITLTKKEQPFNWGKEQQHAFHGLKKKFILALILASFDPEKKIILETNASDQALGSCLCQPDANRQLHPVAYRSKKFSGPELNYNVHNKEPLAIVDAFEEWRTYLERSKYSVEVYSDHENLLYFTTTKKLNQQQVGWAELLVSYNFQIHYQKESENRQADALSRQSNLMTKDTQEQSLLIGKGTTLVLDKPEVATLQNINVLECQPVPEEDQEKVISKHHNGPLLGHPGQDKTIELIQQKYTFPKMRKAVKKYIWKCITCAKNKPARHKPYGEQQQIEAPQQAWQGITMDFIIKLLPSKDTVTGVIYNSILVVVD